MIDDGGPYFPSEQSQLPDGLWNQTLDKGASLRDEVALRLYVCFVTAREDTASETCQIAAHTAFGIADDFIQIKRYLESKSDIPESPVDRKEKCGEED